MSLRHIPFGYAMAGGEIVICEPEAEAVRRIFSLYLHGASLSAIANAMTVPYNQNTSWDKHKVKRVLDNPRYTGSGEYPKLIDEGDYSAAHRLKTAKNTSTPLPCTDDIQSLRAAAHCHECGGRFIRQLGWKRKPRWHCANSDCRNRTALDDDAIKHAVVSALNHIIDNPGVLHIDQPLRPTPLAVTKLQNEVNREMSKTKPDSEQTQNLLLTLAAEKYASCADSRAALAFRAIFEKHEPAVEFDRGLFDATVDKVLIDATGAAILHLKNGQTVPHPEQPRKEPPSC